MSPADQGRVSELIAQISRSRTCDWLGMREVRYTSMRAYARLATHHLLRVALRFKRV